MLYWIVRTDTGTCIADFIKWKTLSASGHADEMSESRQTHVTLHDIDPQALEQLVQYAYTAEIVVGEGNVQVRRQDYCSFP